MKRLAAAALILLCILNLTSLSYAYNNLIVNGGFETGDFSGWEPIYPNVEIDATIVTVAHSGNYAASLYECYGFQKTFPAPVKRGLLTLWAYGPAASRWKTVYVLYEGGIVNQYDYAFYASSQDWYYNEIEIGPYVDEDLIKHYIIGIRFSGDSYNPYYIDDVAFYVLEWAPSGEEEEEPEPTPDEGQTTPPNWPPQPRPQPKPEAKENETQGWIQQIAKGVIEVVKRLLGNPTILLLLILLIVFMAYYTTKRH